MATKFRQNKPNLHKISYIDRIIHGINVVNGSSDVFPWTLVLTCDLIKIFKQYPLFFTKVEKIAYTRNGKDTPNIQIGVTSFLYKISTQF